MGKKKPVAERTGGEGDHNFKPKRGTITCLPPKTHGRMGHRAQHDGKRKKKVMRSEAGIGSFYRKLSKRIGTTKERAQKSHILADRGGGGGYLTKRGKSCA